MDVLDQEGHLRAKSLGTDPRTHRGLLRGLEQYGMQHYAFLGSDIMPTTPLEAVAFGHASEKSLEKMIEKIDFDVHAPVESRWIRREEVVVDSEDGHHVGISIHRPGWDAGETSWPAVVYFHGGGMVMLRTDSPLHTTYVDAIARMGVVAVLVDFRNVLPPEAGDATLRPFPAGLDDCVAAVRWVDAHRHDLRIGSLTLHGDSGGANLAISTALRLKGETQSRNIVDGIFVVDPYISGAYDESRDWKLAHLPSLVELDGYDVSCSASAVYARLYDQQGTHRRNCLAWPYWATEEELVGMPPHLIVTAELDPLKDEGNEYCRRLTRAGVSAVGHIRLGMSHTGDILLRSHVPDEFTVLLSMLKSFVDRIGEGQGSE